jgi:hypothetical protein
MITTFFNCHFSVLIDKVESGLTKALDSVFPEATRLLCTKHMKDNVSEYLKNSLSSTDKQRSEIISKLFGSNGLVAAEDAFEFESKSENLISENPEFARYFDSRLKNRLLEHVHFRRRFRFSNQCSLRFLEYEL